MSTKQSVSFRQQAADARQRLLGLARHPGAIPLVTLVLLALLATTIIAVVRQNRAGATGNNIVIITHDHQVQTVPSSEPDVRSLLAKLAIILHQGDVVEPGLDMPIHQDDFRINIYRASPVRVVDSTGGSVSFSAAATPRSIATQAGYNLYPEDRVTLRAADTFLADAAIGNVVSIQRSIPVTLDINGFTTPTRTLVSTVGDFLSEKRITLGKSGHADPAPSAHLTAGQVVHVVRDGTGIQSATETIPMPVQTITDDTLAYGTSAVRQSGSDGTQVSTYKIVVKDGQVVSKEQVQTIVTVPAVTQIVVLGTNLSGIKGDMAIAGIAASDYQYADYIISNESGWCPTKWQGEYGGCPAYHGTPSAAGLGYGLCQSTPGYKMASAGEDWATNPITQLKWCSGYAARRFGGWYGAYAYWVAHHNW